MAAAPRPRSLFSSLLPSTIPASPTTRLPVMSPVGTTSSPQLSQAKRVAKLVGKIEDDAASKRLSREQSTEHDPELVRQMDRLAINLVRQAATKPREDDDQVVKRKSIKVLLAAASTSTPLPSPRATKVPAKSDLRPSPAMVANATVSPTSGISLTRLVSLFSSNPSLSTQQAVTKVIDPMTEGALLARYLTSQGSSAIRSTATAYVAHDSMQPVNDLLDALLTALGVDNTFVHVPELCAQGLFDFDVMKRIGKVVFVLPDARVSTLYDVEHVYRLFLCTQWAEVRITLCMPPRSEQTLIDTIAQDEFTPALISDIYQLVNYDHASSEVQAEAVKRIREAGLFKVRESVQAVLRKFLLEDMCAKALKQYPDQQANIKTTMGSIHFIAGEFATALECFEQACASSPKATHLMYLGTCLASLNRHMDAVPVLERALQAATAAMAPSSEILTALAQSYVATGRTWEARDFLEKALRVDRDAHLGNPHASVAEDLVVLATYLADFNEPGQAKKLLEEALDMNERLFGKNSVQVAGVLNHLGILLADGGHFSQAKPHLERALAIRERGQPESFEAGQAMNVLAFLLLNTGDMAEARSMGQRALKVFEQCVEADDPLLVESRRLWEEE
jgi:tetratricopeptide (TPR) repeat protein